jgi:WhiB family transcriptional regulator, redox-sensing transcriptional regulator
MSRQHPEQPWHSKARCQGLPPDVFYPPDNEKGDRRRRREERAKKFCRGCPVLRVCREYAIDTREPYGVWGATTPRERQVILTSTIIESSGSLSR